MYCVQQVKGGDGENAYVINGRLLRCLRHLAQQYWTQTGANLKKTC